MTETSNHQKRVIDQKIQLEITMLQLCAKEINMLTENIDQFLSDTGGAEAVPVGAVDAMLGSITNFGVTLLAYLEFKREEAMTNYGDMPAWETADDVAAVAYNNGRIDVLNELIGMLSPLNAHLPG
jgi:hypothetical protein